MGATATTPPAPPKARSNENLDKIDMSLGEEPSRTELEWEEVWVEPNTVVCGGRGGWVQLSLEFSCGWAEPSEGWWDVGAGESSQVSGSSRRASRIPSAGLCLRGRRALWVGILGGSRSADPLSLQKGANTRGWPRLFVRKTPRVSPQACSVWALSRWARIGRSQPFWGRLFESRAGSVKSVVPEKG